MTYTVKRGDTLSGIAAKFGVSVAAIAAANPDRIKNVNKITVGWVLTIPGKQSKKNYSEIGKQVEKCLAEIAELPSVKKLGGML